MRIDAMTATSATAVNNRDGVRVMEIDGVDKSCNQTAPMSVYTRAIVGRFDGYGSLVTALTAARNISRGAERPAVVVERRAEGGYDVREAVWRYFWGANRPPSDRAPFRHFRFEDGSFSQYTALQGGRRVEVTARQYLRAFDGITRWLVDGNQVFEVTHQGGSGRG